MQFYSGLLQIGERQAMNEIIDFHIPPTRSAYTYVKHTRLCSWVVG